MIKKITGEANLVKATFNNRAKLGKSNFALLTVKVEFGFDMTLAAQVTNYIEGSVGLSFEIPDHEVDQPKLKLEPEG